MAWPNDLRQSLRRLIASPIGELGRGRLALRYAVDLVRYSSHQLHKDRASQTAAALTYHMLFSLLPMIVLMLVVLHLFVSDTQRAHFKESAVQYMVDKWIGGGQPAQQAGEVPGDAQATSGQAAGRSTGDENRLEYEEARAKFGLWIQQDVLDKLERVNFGSIGVIGVIMFIFAATNLLTTVERSFNAIYGTNHSRPWYMRLTLYYSVITFSPIVLLAGQWMQVRFQGLLDESGSWTNWLAAPMSAMFPMVTTWLVLCAMYKLIPTTKVDLRAATIGSFIAAALWFIAIELLRMYVARAATSTFYGALYGALALLPLFLLWMWVTWLIILFGLELTYTLQTLRGRQEMEEQARREAMVVGDPMWLVPMMSRIGRAFAAGQPITGSDLADTLHLPLRSVTQLGEHLEAAGLVHRVESAGHTDGGFSLALPPDRIHIAQLLELGRVLTVGGQAQRRGPDWAVLDQLAQVQQQAAAQMTLQQVLDGPSQNEQET